MNKEKFRTNLLNWYSKNRSSFPWRKTRDPYKILISEILLRKTTRNQVNDIYSNFIHKYPNFQKLKTSKLREIEKDLKCLGLYRVRAKLLKQAGKFVVDNFDSAVPQNPYYISKIPGMGPYSTNAILCFACNKSVPLVDTNVVRVYSRVFNIKLTAKRKHLDKRIWKFSESMLPEYDVRDFNFALLDFANKVCTPKNPRCFSCPMNKFCQFFNSGSS